MRETSVNQLYLQIGPPSSFKQLVPQRWSSQESVVAGGELGKSEHGNKTVNVARGEISQKLDWTWKQMERLMGA